MPEQPVVQPKAVEQGPVSTIPQIESISKAVNWRQVGLFLAVTFALTYALNLLLHLGWGYGNNVATGALVPLQMLIPAAVAIVLQLFVFKASPICHLRLASRWFFYVYLGYVALSILGAAATIARPDMTILTTVNLVVLVLIVLFIVILRLVAGGEAFRRAGLVRFDDSTKCAVQAGPCRGYSRTVQHVRRGSERIGQLASCGVLVNHRR
jgi:hypothetical protein